MTYRVNPSESLKLGEWKIEFSGHSGNFSSTKKIAGYFRRPHKLGLVQMTTSLSI